MYKKILVAYNGTQESRSALHACISIAPPPTTEIHLLAVVDPPLPPLLGEYGGAITLSTEEDVAAIKQQMAHELALGQSLLTDAGQKVISHLEVGDPVTIIGALADQLGADLVIVGHSRHKSWAMRWWRGSTDVLLIEKVHCCLLVAQAHQSSDMPHDAK
jgi:nucleotide-binding universal stress UspA family protein